MILLVLLIAFAARAGARASVDSFTRPRYLDSLSQFTHAIHTFSSFHQFTPSNHSSIQSINSHLQFIVCLNSHTQFIPSVHTHNAIPSIHTPNSHSQFTPSIHSPKSSLRVVNRRFPGDRPRPRFEHPSRVFARFPKCCGLQGAPWG